MFGWLKNLFGSKQETEIAVPPLPVKVKKTTKKSEKTTVKKAAPKAKAAKSPRKKKEVITPVADASVVDVAPVVTKKKGGRPKKNLV